MLAWLTTFLPACLSARTNRLVVLTDSHHWDWLSSSPSSFDYILQQLLPSVLTSSSSIVPQKLLQLLNVANYFHHSRSPLLQHHYWSNYNFSIFWFAFSVQIFKMQTSRIRRKTLYTIRYWYIRSGGRMNAVFPQNFSMKPLYDTTRYRMSISDTPVHPYVRTLQSVQHTTIPQYQEEATTQI